MALPRPEFPQPQWQRADWLNLNGTWQFEIDHGLSGQARQLYAAAELPLRITLPFCPESRLSGIGNTDFMACVWYKRRVQLPDGWQQAGRLTRLHIGACDYQTDVWVNGHHAGSHYGGYVPFSFDITPWLHSGENDITICAQDQLRSRHQPSGKQCQQYYSAGCSYTRTTGIWQTVWLENLPVCHIASARYTPLVAQGALRIEASCHQAEGQLLQVTATLDGQPAAQGSGVVAGGHAEVTLVFDHPVLWQPENPALYELQLSLGQDRVQSYAGLRQVAWHQGKLWLNGRVVYQRLVLDQGFYPDGIYTAPDDQALQQDILLSKQMGFNGARLHQKIFEPRFLYHADRLGYLVWGEHANWGLDHAAPQAWAGFIPEWLEALQRDYNHPAIIGWCPFNETPPDQDPRLLQTVAAITRAVDATRPVIDASGWFQTGAGDIRDVHDYQQDPAVFAAHYAPMAQGQAVPVFREPGEQANGLPHFISEFGGIWWSDDDDQGWGYGQRVKDRQEFLARYRGLVEACLNNPAISGFCYTQLTDVEQEQNGLYTADRRAKFDPQVIRQITAQPAAAEQPAAPGSIE